MEVLDLAHKRLGAVGVVASSVVTIAISAVYMYHLHLSSRRAGEPPVRWSWIPLLGNAIELGSRPLEFLGECAGENPTEEVFGMVVAGNRMFIITDVLSYNVVLKPPKSLTWEEFHDAVLTNFFGASFNHPQLTGAATFDEHLMRKWYSNYLLSDGALGDLTTRAQNQIARDLRAGGGGGAVPLYEFVGRMVFQASVASLFSPEAAEDPALFAAFQAFDQHMPLALAGFKVDYAGGPYRARAVLLRAIRQYKSEGNCEFIRKRFEYFDAFGNPANTDSFQLAMLWASVGNTMPAVFWLLYYLVSTPEALRAVQQEIAAVCPSSASGDASFNQEQLNRLVFLDACITEALRLCSGSMIMRHAREACEVTLASGKVYKFRKGDRVGLCPPLWHRDCSLYPEPLRFNPWRWVPTYSVPSAGSPVDRPSEETLLAAQGRVQLVAKDGKQLPSGMGFLPFGGGVTHCPGRRFARNEVKTVAVCVLATLRLELCPGQAPPQFDGARAGLGIFPPKTDVLVSISAL